MKPITFARVAALLILSLSVLTQVSAQSMTSGKGTQAGVPAGATKIAFWEYFSGGDGSRIQQIIDAFNKSQQSARNPLYVDLTALPGGKSFYDKVHSAIGAGNAPDFMTYHLSHFAAGLQAGDLLPLTQQQLGSAGMKLSDFSPGVIKRSLTISSADGNEGDLYGVPLDTDTLVLFYNKDIVKRAGLLGSDGKPTDLEGIQSFTNALKSIKAKTGLLPLTSVSANDPATVWRLWFTLFKQLGGVLSEDGVGVSMDDLSHAGKQALQEMVSWSTQGLMGQEPSDSTVVARFTAGRAALMIAGDWEVSTLAKLQKKGSLPFSYGIVPFPKLYENQHTWADSDNLSVPNNTTNPISAHRLGEVLSIIAYIERHSIKWGAGGHLPMFLPVADGNAFRGLAPNDQYSTQATRNAMYEPINTIFGVGNPTYGAVGEYLTPALQGKSSVDDAMSNFATTLQSLLDLYG